MKRLVTLHPRTKKDFTRPALHAKMRRWLAYLSRLRTERLRTAGEVGQPILMPIQMTQGE
jgi:hypothetical protein